MLVVDSMATAAAWLFWPRDQALARLASATPLWVLSATAGGCALANAVRLGQLSTSPAWPGVLAGAAEGSALLGALIGMRAACAKVLLLRSAAAHKRR